MKRQTLVAVLLALLAVVALGVAAATLDSAVTSDGGGIGTGAPSDTGPSETTDRTSPTTTPGGEIDLSVPAICYPSLREPPALLLFGLALVAVGGLVYRDTGSAFAGVVVATALGVPTSVVVLLLSLCRPLEPPEGIDLGLGGNENGTLPEGGGGDGGVGFGDGSGGVSTPEILFVAVVVLALVASLLVLLATAGDDAGTERPDGSEREAPEASDPSLAALARTAGEAADRIETAEGGNEVYRAWREMTEVLDVDRPASSTPSEFADAAVAAGVAEEPVARLTDVFERVRYGGEDPTDDRERRAVEALRRIEETHGEGDATGSRNGGEG